MTITASARKTVPTRADLHAATAALAQMSDGSLELNQSSTINKVALNCTYLLMTPSGIKQAARSIHHPCDRHALRSKSP
jgi:hypothetical protein